MTERIPAYRVRAAEVVQASTRAYFEMEAKGEVTPIQRFNAIISSEEAQQFAKVMGVSKAEMVRATLLGTPREFHEDYLGVLIEKNIISPDEAYGIVTSLASSPVRRT